MKKSKKDGGVEMQIESTIKSSFDESIKNLVGNNTLTNDILPGDYGEKFRVLQPKLLRHNIQKIIFLEIPRSKSPVPKFDLQNHPPIVKYLMGT